MDDEVFHESTDKKLKLIEEDKHVEEEETTKNAEIATKPLNESDLPMLETVSEHFRQLFNQLEDFMKTASDADKAYVHRYIENMKHGMQTINSMFDDIINMGWQLEKLLEDRANNNDKLSKN